jgi:hypothetical protein
MSRLSIADDPQNTIFELTQDEIENPKALMFDFCHAIPLGMTRAFLWDLLKSALRDRYCSDLLQNRELLLEFYETLQKALLGMYLIADRAAEESA